MYPKSFLFLLLAFLLPLISVAQDSIKEIFVAYSIVKGSRVTINGSTNINEFSCFTESSTFTSPIKISPTPEKEIVAIDNGILKIRSEALDCGNVVMNKNLCTTMKSEQYPYIIVEVNEVHAADGKVISANQDLTIKFYLTLAGRKKLNTVKVKMVNEGGGNYHFTGSHKILLSSYGLEPPKAFFGLITVSDLITVQFDLMIHVEDNHAMQAN